MKRPRRRNYKAAALKRVALPDEPGARPTALEVKIFEEGKVMHTLQVPVRAEDDMILQGHSWRPGWTWDSDKILNAAPGFLGELIDEVARGLVNEAQEVEGVVGPEEDDDWPYEYTAKWRLLFTAQNPPSQPVSYPDEFGATPKALEVRFLRNGKLQRTIKAPVRVVKNKFHADHAWHPGWGWDSSRLEGAVKDSAKMPPFASRGEFLSVLVNDSIDTAIHELREASGTLKEGPWTIEWRLVY